MHIIKTKFCISSATGCGISSSCRRMHGVAVMRCKKQTAVCFLMIYTALRAVMICQACGLDKKIRQVETCRIFWLGNRDFYRLACARCDSANSPQESLFALRRIPFAVRIPILDYTNKKAASLLRYCFFWLGNRDSNPNKQSQSLSCYRYTIPHREEYYIHSERKCQYFF